MLCDIGSSYGFVGLWVALSVMGLTSMLLLSTALFIPYYIYPTFESWQYKSNPKYPSPALIRKEIIFMCKGLSVATICPAFTLVASQWGWSNGYCGDPHNIGWQGHLLQMVIIFAFTDFVEYGYHWIGHRYKVMWSIHKHHHQFYNPSPYSVIADEFVDQFFRTTPMVILPMAMPINMDLLFAIFAILFYGYGVYLHWGYESPMLSAHNPFFNTSYHHYSHHAVSVIGKPVYTGFFFKLWDQLFGTEATTPCQCVECRPKRTKEEWKATIKPDYSILLNVGWWLKCHENVVE